MKYSATLLCIALALSCKQPAPPPSAPENTEQSAQKALIEQYFLYFNQHQWVAMADLYTDTAAIKDPSLGTKITRHSHNDIVKKYTELHQMFPDVRDSIVSMHHAGKHVVVEFISTGTAPDQSRFELPICTIFKIENGRFSEDFTYYSECH